MRPSRPATVARLPRMEGGEPGPDRRQQAIPPIAWIPTTPPGWGVAAVTRTSCRSSASRPVNEPISRGSVRVAAATPSTLTPSTASPPATARVASPASRADSSIRIVCRTPGPSVPGLDDWSTPALRVIAARGRPPRPAFRSRTAARRNCSHQYADLSSYVVRCVAFGCRYDTKNSTASGLDGALLPFSQSLSEASDNTTGGRCALPW